MKTTVEISDALFQEVKRYAAANGLTFRQVIENGLRAAVRGAPGRRRFKLRDASFGGKATPKDYSWPEIESIIYEGRGG